jgi:hypothetical protein
MSQTVEYFESIFFDDYYPRTVWARAGEKKIVYWTDQNPIIDGRSSSPLSGDELRIAASAFSDWDKELDSIEFVYTSLFLAADISVGWTNLDNSYWGYWTSSWRDYVRYTGTLELNKNLRESSFSLSIEKNLKHTLLHEIGNLLGLGDISRDSNISSVLTDPFIVTGELSDDDKYFVKLLYSEANFGERYSAQEVQNTITIIVNKGVVSDQALILSNLVEEIRTLTDGSKTHTISYGEQVYDYSEIDSLVAIVTRNDDFTDEFQSEISDIAPSASEISYSELVSLVGIRHIDSVLINIAGADGFYVG